MEMGGNFGGLKESNNSFIHDNQAIDELQSTICSSLQMGGKIEEAVKRGMQTFTPTLIEDSVRSSMQALMPPLVEEAVSKGIQAAIPALVEEVLHKGMQALMPVMVEEMKRMIGTSLPLMQPSNQPSNSRKLPFTEIPSASRKLHLHFQLLRKPLNRIFTWKSLREHGISLQVVLKDESGNIVEAGADSSMKIKIVVLDGDFSEDNGKTFHESVCRQRDNKPPLLSRKCESTLNKGVADVDDITFTDNSSWMRSKRFKLGAEVVKSVSNGVIVREAVSEAFEVKERRGEFYQKKGTPALNDEVWRLHNIGRGGPIHTRLEKENINSVNDLLQRHQVNADSLKKIVQVPDNRFRNIIKQAKSALSTRSNSIQPEYNVDVNVEKGTMPQIYETPNEMSRLCGLNNNHSLLPADNFLPATGLSVNPGDSQLQLILSESPPEDTIVAADNSDRFQQLENELRDCISNTQPIIRRGLRKPRWHRVGAALRWFTVYRIVINRQACRASKKQRYY